MTAHRVMPFVRRILPLLAGVTLAACSHASVQTTQDYTGAALLRPDRVMVRDFVVSPNEVTLDSGRLAGIRRMFSGQSDSEQQIAKAQAVVAAISNTLVQEIQAMGLPAERIAADATVAPSSRVALIDGNVLDINEGNRAKRVAIGFGAGASDVKTSTALAYLAPMAPPREIATFQASGTSGYAPGVVVTGGAGAAAGAATSVAVSGGMQAYREKNTATTSADADDIGKKIAEQLRQQFIAQGWIAKN